MEVLATFVHACKVVVVTRSSSAALACDHTPFAYTSDSPITMWMVCQRIPNFRQPPLPTATLPPYGHSPMPLAHAGCAGILARARVCVYAARLCVVESNPADDRRGARGGEGQPVVGVRGSGLEDPVQAEGAPRASRGSRARVPGGLLLVAGCFFFSYMRCGLVHNIIREFAEIYSSVKPNADPLPTPPPRPA